MLTAETLVNECVGRYITTPNGALRLTNLINSRTYADSWAALMQWAARQYSLKNSFSLPPIGVFMQVAGEQGGGPIFLFYKGFVDKYSLEVPANQITKEKDAPAVVKMYMSSLSKYSTVAPETLKLALSHMFLRLGEMIASRGQCVIEVGFATFIAEDRKAAMVLHTAPTDEKLAQTKDIHELAMNAIRHHKKRARYTYIGKHTKAGLVSLAELITNTKNKQPPIACCEGLTALGHGDLSTRLSRRALSPGNRICVTGRSPSPPRVQDLPASHRNLYPPVLDSFSRTNAATFPNGQSDLSPSAKIAGFYSPEAQQWQLRSGSHSLIHLSTAYDELDTNTKRALRSISVEDCSDEHQNSLDRYNHYIRNVSDPKQIAPIKNEWIHNVLILLNLNLHSVEQNNLKGLLREMIKDMTADYQLSVMRSILDYVLRSPHERSRLDITYPPAPTVKDWGMCPSQPCPPVSWREPIQQAWLYLEKKLFIVNPAAIGIQQMWSRYQDCSLIWIPRESELPISIQDFETRQKAHLREQLSNFSNNWMKEVEEIFKISNSIKDDGRSEKFFDSIATLMTNHLRSIVEKSVRDFHSFITQFSSAPELRFSSNAPASILNVFQGSNAAKSLSPLFGIKLVIQRRKIQLQTLPNEIESALCRVFDAILVSLDTLPRIETKLYPLLDNPRSLVLKVDDQRILALKDDIVRVFCRSVESVVTVVNLYDEYAYLLDESQRLSDLLTQPHTLLELREKVSGFRNLTMDIESKSKESIRCQMLVLDCSKVNESLLSKAQDLCKQVLAFVATRNIEHNVVICDEFKAAAAALLKKPINSRELVDLARYSTNFKQTTLKRLLNDCSNSADELRFLFECEHLVNDEVLSHSGSTFSWVKKIEAIIGEADAQLLGERRKMEGQFESRKDKFAKLLDSYAAQVADFAEFVDVKREAEFNTIIRNVKENLTAAVEECRRIQEQDELLGMTITVFSTLDDIQNKIVPFEELWVLVEEFHQYHSLWVDGPVFSLNAEQVKTKCDSMWRASLKLSKTLAIAAAGVALNIKTSLDAFKQNLPLVEILCNPGLRQRHWSDISDIVGFDLRPDDHTSLTRFVDMGVAKYTEQLMQVSDSASKEYSIEKSADGMKKEWASVEFSAAAYRDSGTFILIGGGLEEIQTLLDDHIVKTQTMKGSSFAKPFAQTIAEWETWLTNMQDIIDNWLQVQTTWLYLEPIFSSEDIMKQMPEEGNLFRKVDASWRAIMSDVIAAPAANAVSSIPDILATLKSSRVMLDRIQLGLNQYLETKRLFFPRFFFLSNDELLEILSETKDPTRVQPHLKKCFEGIAKLEFQENMDITALFSSEGERLALTSSMNAKDANGAVERWLSDVETLMFSSVKSSIQSSIAAFSNEAREQWSLDWPGQVVLAVSQIFWTQAVEKAIESGTLKQFLEMSNSQLQKIVALVRQPLTRLQRRTLGALVVIDVHARDTVQALVNAKISRITDFQWISQLRYYWFEDTVKIRIINSELAYGYEYLGNSDRLVITPLTDRCYRTLMGAMQFNLGGAPEGPAGTGKTETVKDLAKAVAIQCVVFNCSDGLDYLAMSKFFKGLASSGAWACFDEFNRIDLEVLSVVAQQVSSIQRATAAKLGHFRFEGTEIRLRQTCNIFITMNPGYAGRSELPDNLKALFRTVAMMVPNYEMIAEITLYSCGFIEARSLARKIVATFRLCSEQLSSQDHYDYGMRAVKAVLMAAGNLKRLEPNENESRLMLRSINDVNLPKFLSQDIPLFQGIIGDLFPGVSLPVNDYSQLLPLINADILSRGLEPVPEFLAKILQFHEMIKVRHGLMLVGQPFSGKTSAIRILSSALSKLGEESDTVEVVTINPKSITLNEIYGQFDAVSHEWKDGVLSIHFRRLASLESPSKKWIVFDGPVDTLWIENMNTVLDDNKKLCLMSGEIIQMSSTMNMIFEVADLAVASPATVSRCGMVYVEPQCLGIKPLLDSWLTSMSSMESFNAEQFTLLFKRFVPTCLELVRRKCTEYCTTSDMNLVISMFRIFKASLKESKSVIGSRDMEGLFVFSLIWSVGASVDFSGRQEFDATIRTISNEAKLQAKLPDKCLMYDVLWTNSSWVNWSGDPNATGTSFQIEPDARIQEIIVPTIDSARYSAIAQLFARNRIPGLFVGPTGTGKTAYVGKALTQLDKEAFLPLLINFSAQTTASQTREIIDAKMERKRKGVFGSPGGRNALVFIDDLNMPKPEVFGAQLPIELIRQLIDHGGWYDVADASFRNLIDTTVLAAMGPAGGGRNFVTTRLTRHFNHVSMTPFDNDNLNTIFRTILLWHLGKGFAPDIALFASKIVDATRSIFLTAISELLPTPTRSHYTFNLRDFASVIRGICMSHPDEISDRFAMIRLWVHEIHRVFADRLIDDDDSIKFLKWVRSACTKTLNADFDQCLLRLDKNGDGKVDTLDEVRGLLFGDFLTKKGSRKPYEEIPDLIHMREVFMAHLDDYNQQCSSSMRLVLFRYALEHISRLSRILKQPGGHALLVGVGGTGRQSLTRLAAHVSGYKVFQVEMSKNYGITEWREDLKKVLRSAGEKMIPTVFLFTDLQIKYEEFLEDINGILNSGEVPNLFPLEERAEICANVAPNFKRAHRGAEGTPQQYMSFFIDMVRAHLHVFLCMSPIGDALRSRLRMFPSFVNCCTINWMQKWPQDALETVAHEFLADVDLPDSTRRCCVSMCVNFHQSADDLAKRFYQELRRNCYVTPSSYLELIMAFKILLAEKRKQVTTSKNTYEVGLQVLAATAAQVKAMLVEIEELRPVLIRTGQETSEMIVQVDKETIEAEAIRAGVKQEESVANEKAAAAKAIADECGAELAQAMPILEAAVAALNTLTKNDLVEVKAMKSPPAGVLVVMEAVCIMMNIAPTRTPDSTGKMVKDYWDPAKKKLLSDPKLLSALSAYDKDNIPREIIKKIATYIENPLFDPGSVKKASKAAFGLCSWVRAMYQYDEVANTIRPKREALDQAKAEYAIVEKGLLAKQAELSSVEYKLANFKSTLAGMQQKKADLEAQVELCGKKLLRGQQLIGGLGGEKDRWTEAAINLGVQYENLVGDVILASGVIAYLGAFTASYRSSCVDSWRKLCKASGLSCAERFSLANALGDSVKIRQWTNDGLPNDAFSIDNAIIIDKARRWPLMIDPQGQANFWIRNLERERKLIIFKMADADFARRLEGGIQFGIPCLLENVGEELDPTFEPVLLKQTYKKGGATLIKLGDTEVEYSENFRFYITTKLRNPHYLPELSTKVTLINFMITPAGLEDQLLGIIVARERPELQTEKNRLIVQSAENRKNLKEIETEILKVLSSSEGNILDDESAIQVLSASKNISNDIAEKQLVADKTEKEIDVARMGYKPVAAHSSVLFFCIADLANIDPMYQYSLAWFIILYEKAIAGSEPSNVLETRLQSLNDYFTFSLFCAICRSLFEKDKLLFSFLLAVNILKNKGTVNHDQWRFLMTGGVGVESDGAQALSNPFPSWLQQTAWAEICRLSASFPEFSSFASTFNEYGMDWKRIFDGSEPHRIRLPSSFQTDLSSFQKLLILRCLRPDKVIPAVRDFVGETLGQRFIEVPPFDLAGAFKDSDPAIPLLFVLSPGSDPFSSLIKFATDLGFSSKLESISLGQGQGPHAAAAIIAGQAKGSWVILQNCHLAVSWMTALERIIESTTVGNVHADYRLWLTSYPSEQFPISILQKGIKMTNEPPKGLRANLLSSYSRDPISDPEFFSGTNHQPQWASLLFGLSFFHALVQERRSFGPLGWNIPYEFNESDLRISVRQLHMFVGRSETIESIPYEAIRYLVGECNYGGRVTEEWDRRTLSNLLLRYISPDMLQAGASMSALGAYQVPALSGSYPDYLEHIKALPSFARPEVFGLHENADITKDRNETATLFRSILLTQARSTTSGTKSKELILKEISSDIVYKIPPPFDLDSVYSKFPVNYKESMNIVLRQELIRYNRLVVVIRNSMNDLQKTLAGLMAMSFDLEQISDSLFNGCVPKKWLSVSYPTMKPLSSYISDLMNRLQNFQKWMDTGIAPDIFWFSGFFFTQSFLTGVLQNFARKHAIPIDEVSFDFEFVKKGTLAVRPTEGAYVDGLFLEGARWDDETCMLAESEPKILFSPAPVIWLHPMKTSEINAANKYDCPVYKTTERRGILSTTGHSTNFVMSIRLPTDRPASHWVQRGVALVTQLDD